MGMNGGVLNYAPEFLLITWMHRWRPNQLINPKWPIDMDGREPSGIRPSKAKTWQNPHTRGNYNDLNNAPQSHSVYFVLLIKHNENFYFFWGGAGVTGAIQKNTVLSQLKFHIYSGGIVWRQSSKVKSRKITIYDWQCWWGSGCRIVANGPISFSSCQVSMESKLYYMFHASQNINLTFTMLPTMGCAFESY